MDEIIDSSGKLNEVYHKHTFRKILLLIICIVGVILVVGLLSVSIYKGVTLVEAYEIIWNHIIGVEYPRRSAEWWADLYITQSVLPRICVGILAGVSLAAAGSLMQSLMNNPLADPYTTGISSGACFGAVASIVVGISFASSGGYGIVINAFIGAMIPAIIIILLSTRIHMTPATMILLGTAVSYFFNSMVTYMMVTTNADTLQDAYLWQIGSLDGMTWDVVPLMLMVAAIGSAFTLLMAKNLNILSLGENNAKTLGLDVEVFRILCLIVMAVMTAGVVAFTGILGFVGLVSPHIVRVIVGSDNKFVIPISMAMGALLLLVADYVAVLLGNLPVGVVMAIIGSPIFLALIIWNKKSYGAIY